MPQSLSKVYLHIVFSTKDRVEVIDDEVKTELYRYMAGILKNLECPAIKIGGAIDHIHILNVFSRKITISKMVGILKKDSSKWVKTKGEKFQNFHWQNGYGIFSVGQSDVDAINSYIGKQNIHHRKTTFQDELRVLFKEYNIAYDEKYIWD